jgi:hypothetical protein
MVQATVKDILKVLNDLYSSIKETYELNKGLVANRTMMDLEKLDIGTDDLLINGYSDLVSDVNDYRDNNLEWWRNK